MITYLRNSKGDAVCYIDKTDNSIVFLDGRVLGFIDRDDNEAWTSAGVYLGIYYEDTSTILRHKHKLPKPNVPARRPIKRTAVARPVRVIPILPLLNTINVLDKYSKI